jgi:hypothetical protein
MAFLLKLIPQAVRPLLDRFVVALKLNLGEELLVELSDLLDIIIRTMKRYSPGDARSLRTGTGSNGRFDRLLGMVLVLLIKKSSRNWRRAASSERMLERDPPVSIC